MFTLEQEPWVQYLTIDEITLTRNLREDTPESIRIKYLEYLNEQAKRLLEDDPMEK